jgi:hypothetical protein
VFVQAPAKPQTIGVATHSSTSAHANPSPIQPVLQAQVREPAVFVQVAWLSHPPFAVAHSLTSTQLLPSPVQPLWHVQM